MQISDLDEIDSTTASLLQNLEKESKKLTDEEFAEFWREADVNNDGKLDYDEFIKIIQNLS